MFDYQKGLKRAIKKICQDRDVCGQQQRKGATLEVKLFDVERSISNDIMAQGVTLEDGSVVEPHPGPSECVFDSSVEGFRTRKTFGNTDVDTSGESLPGFDDSALDVNVNSPDQKGTNQVDTSKAVMESFSDTASSLMESASHVASQASGAYESTSRLQLHC